VSDATIGHNSLAGKELLAQIEKIERIEAEKQEAAESQKEVYSYLKAQGFDTKIVRKIVRMRKMDAAKRDEEQALTETYLHACGML
jgi:uncharacterized protein (UPF0335 family)